MDFPIKPLADRVVVELIGITTQTESGLELPAGMKSKYRIAEVKAVGNGILVQSGQRVKPEVSPGDKVQIGAAGGDEISINGNEYLVIPERAIISILDKNVKLTL